MKKFGYVLVGDCPIRCSNFDQIKVGDGIIDCGTRGFITGGDSCGIYHIVIDIIANTLVVGIDGGVWMFDRTSGKAVSQPTDYKIAWWNSSEELIKLDAKELKLYSSAYYDNKCRNYTEFKTKREGGFYFIKVKDEWEPGYYSSETDLWNVILDNKNYKTGRIKIGDKISLPTD